MAGNYQQYLQLRQSQNPCPVCGRKDLWSSISIGEVPVAEPIIECFNLVNLLVDSSSWNEKWVWPEFWDYCNGCDTIFVGSF